jgi:hypothetical protein
MQVIIQNNKKGVFTEEGKEIIPCEWSDIKIRKTCIVVTNAIDLEGVFSLDGKLLINCIWRKTTILRRCIITKLNNRCAVYALDGTEILPWRWVEVIAYPYGLKVMKHGSNCWGFYSYTGDEIVSCQWPILTVGDFFIEVRNGAGELHRFSFTGEEIK